MLTAVLMKKDKEEIICKTFCKNRTSLCFRLLVSNVFSRFHLIIFEEIPVLLPQ